MVLSEREADLIHQRMSELGIENQSAFLRKMAIDGYIIHVELREIRALTKLLGICSNNLNQFVRRAHETGSIYAADIEDLNERLTEIRAKVDMLLKQFIKHGITADKFNYTRYN